MSKIHLIMPMGGGGTRFGNRGFRVPKPLIDLQGKPFFYWATQSVAKYVETGDITFVVLQEHVTDFHIDSEIRKYYSDANVVVIPHVLNGAVLTCLEGVRGIRDDSPILFNDCDHAFLAENLYDYCKEDGIEYDGALLTFNSNSKAFSYVRFDDAHRVIGTVEKQVVSDEAICGAYYFKDKDTFESAAISYLEHCDYQEFFISGVYNEMVKRGDMITTFRLDEHISFGTPDEYDRAINDERLKVFLA